MGVRRLLQPRGPQIRTSGCPLRAMMPSATCSSPSCASTVLAQSGATCRVNASRFQPIAYLSSRPTRRSPTGSRRTHRTMRICPTRSSKLRCLARELQVRPVQAHRRRPLVRLQGKARLHLRRHLLRRQHPPRRQDQVERHFAARDRELGAEPQPQRQRPGGQGLPPRRHQRSAEPSALHGGGHGDLRSVRLGDLQGRNAVEL